MTTTTTTLTVRATRDMAVADEKAWGTDWMITPLSDVLVPLGYEFYPSGSICGNRTCVCGTKLEPLRGDARSLEILRWFRGMWN